MNAHEEVRRFNETVLWGGSVMVSRNGFEKLTRTRARAQVLHDGQAVVWLDDIVGAVPLDRVRLPNSRAGAV